MATVNQNQFENMYEGLKKPMSVTRYTLMRGVTDFGNLKQYDLFESGYPFLVVVDYPKFLQKLKKVNTDYENLINNYLHILEYEFRGLDGLDNITGDTQELTNGINTLNLISFHISVIIVFIFFYKFLKTCLYSIHCFTFIKGYHKCFIINAKFIMHWLIFNFNSCILINFTCT